MDHSLEPLSGPDQLMHLELLIATLKRCRETGEPFVLDDTHPLKQHMRATARQRALAMLRDSGAHLEGLRTELAFHDIIDHLEDQ